jgi:hypothetical protein
MLVEELGDRLERLLGLGRAHIAVVVRMRLSFIDLQRGLDSGLSQLARHAHRAAEQEIARAGGGSGSGALRSASAFAGWPCRAPAPSAPAARVVAGPFALWRAVQKPV